MGTMKLNVMGNSIGAVFPKEVLAILGAERGDRLFWTKTPNGIELTTYDPAFEEQMEVFRAVAKKRRNVLRALAK